jgi:hypothetical protein
MRRRPLGMQGVAMLALMMIGAAVGSPATARAAAACPGDCNGDGRVTIAEIVIVLRMDLGDIAAGACPAGTRNPGMVDNVDLVCAFRNALYGTCEACP